MTWRGRIAGALLVAAVAVAGGTFAAGWFLGKPYHVDAGPPPRDLAIEALTISSRSGSELRAWLVRDGGMSEGARAPRGALLVLHGLHSSRKAMVPRARFLARAGYAVLLPDLQAQGESPGAHITFGALEARDAEACLAFLVQRFPTLPLGAIGVSMGGAALVLARDRPPLRALILESTFATIARATEDRLALRLAPPVAWLAPLLLAMMKPISGISPDELRPIERIADVGCPVLLMHGRADRSTGFAQGQALYDAARPPKEFWAIDGADHVDLHAFAPADYERRVLAFLDAHLR